MMEMDERTRRGKSLIRLGMLGAAAGFILMPMGANTKSPGMVIAAMIVGIGGGLLMMAGLALTYRHEVTQARSRRAGFLAGLGAIDAEQGGHALARVGGASAYNTMLAQALIDSGEASSMADALAQLGIAGNAAVEELHGGSQQPVAEYEQYPDYTDDDEDYDDEPDEDYPRGAAPAPSPAQPVTPPSSDLWGA